MSAHDESLDHRPAFGRMYDPAIILVAGVLMTLGVTMVYSASVSVRGAPFDWHRWWDTPLRQALFALCGFLAMLVAAHVDYRMLAWRQRGGWWKAGLLSLVACGLLVAVLIPGVGSQALGARRSIPIPGLGFGFQPSEIAKVVLVIWLAALLTRPPVTVDGPPSGRSGRRSGGEGGVGDVTRQNLESFFFGFVPALASSGIVIGLTAIEDFGTAALMGAVMFIMLLVGGARLWHLGLTCLAAAAAGAVLVITKPHRVARLETFFSPTPDLAGAGYQVHQAQLAIGSGGWWGRGLGAGVQKYGYLPQDNNDFIMAIICEELGVVGGMVVVALFLVFLWRGWRLSRRAPDRFGQLLALGLTLTICLQAAFNVGVVTNSVPTKGISLPFVSAGGSGVVLLGLATGLLASIGRRRALE